MVIGLESSMDDIKVNKAEENNMKDLRKYPKCSKERKRIGKYERKIKSLGK